MSEDVEAGADLVARFDGSIPVTIAFRAKLADASQWYLYIAADRLDATRVDRLEEGYEEVHRLTRRNPNWTSSR